MRSALIISQFAEQRVRLQRLVEHMPEFSSILSAHALDEGLEIIKASAPFDIIFIADSFQQADISLFLEIYKAERKPRAASFIMVSRGEEQSSQAISNGMLVGIHGFLCEPLSIDSIAETVRIADCIRSKTSGVRLRAATGLMLSEIFLPSNAQGTPDLTVWEKIQHSCESYKQLTGESVTMAIVNKIQSMPASKRISNYSGVSKRVRELLQRKFGLRI